MNKTCPICGYEVKRKFPRRGSPQIYCSKHCLQITRGVPLIFIRIRQRIFNPIYQARQLGLIEIKTKKIIVKEIKYYW